MRKKNLIIVKLLFLRESYINVGVKIQKIYSYSNETVVDDEINDYLEMLKENTNEIEEKCNKEDVKSLQIELDKLKSENEEYKNTIKQIGDERNDLKNKNKSLKDQLNKNEDERKNFQEELDELKEQFKNLQEQSHISDSNQNKTKRILVKI